MIRALVDFALNNRFVVLAIAVLLIGWGAISFHNLPVEAYPDIADNYVTVITQWPGRAAEGIGGVGTRRQFGAGVGPVDERHGLVVACAHRPSATLEPIPAVLVRRAAVSLHHPIDSDLRHGRQLQEGRSFVGGAPSWAATHPYHERRRDDPTSPPGFDPP